MIKLQNSPNEGDGTFTYSSIHLITPEILNGVYLKENNRFLPNDFEWSWNGSILGHVVHENSKSGTQSLQNGNFLITEASLGQISEIANTGDLLWSYRNPAGSAIYNQFDNLPQNVNSIYKAEKYPSSFPGFTGKNMSPQGIIENQNANTDTCLMTSIVDYLLIEKIGIENPVVNGKIQFNQNISLYNVSITDINGKVVFSKNNFSGDNLKIDLIPAMYLLKLNSNKQTINLKILVQ